MELIVKKKETAAAITAAVNAGTCKNSEQAAAIAKEHGDILLWGVSIPDGKDYERTDDIDRVITEILKEIGMPTNLKGYRYMREAIKMAVQDPSILEIGMTKSVYPSVGQRFNTTGSRTERAIRHAVEVTIDRKNIDVIQKYFGGSISANKGKPTNGEFISAIADYIKLNK